MVGKVGFEPTDLLLPKQALYQTELFPENCLLPTIYLRIRRREETILVSICWLLYLILKKQGLTLTYGWKGGARTHDLVINSHSLLPTELLSIVSELHSIELSKRCCFQRYALIISNSVCLSRAFFLAPEVGFEPTTYGL